MDSEKSLDSINGPCYLTRMTDTQMLKLVIKQAYQCIWGKNRFTCIAR